MLIKTALTFAVRYMPVDDACFLREKVVERLRRIDIMIESVARWVVAWLPNLPHIIPMRSGRCTHRAAREPSSNLLPQETSVESQPWQIEDFVVNYGGSRV